jgi:ankyrin repeat protein
MNQFEAAQDDDLQQLRVALTVDNVNNVHDSGWTALHYSTYRGTVECVKYCIEMGANVNARSDDRQTPLHLASFRWGDHVNVVRVLLAAGAMVDATNNDGDTPLHDVSSNGLVNVVRVLLDAGANVDATNYDGSTPLYLGILNNNVEVTRLLIDRGGKCQTLRWTRMFQKSLIGSTRSLSRDPIVDLFPSPSLGYTNSVVQQ